MNRDKIEDDLYGFTGDLLNSDQPVRISVHGTSMYPLLRHGDQVVVKKCTLAELSPGDVIGVRTGSHWVAHRLVKKRSRDKDIQLITKGDTCRRQDPETPGSGYVGKITSFTRGGQENSLETRFYRNMGILTVYLSWLMTPLFILVLRISKSVARLKETGGRVAGSFRFSGQGSGRLISLNGILSALQGLLPFLVIYLVKLLVDRVNIIVLHTGSAGEIHSLAAIIILTAGVFWVSSALTPVSGLLREKLSQRVTRNSLEQLYAKHTALSLGYLEEPSRQDKIFRADQEAGFRPARMVTSGMMFIQSAVSCLVISGFLLFIYWPVFILMVVALLPGFVARARLSAEFYHFRRETSDKERESHYYHWILTGLPFAKEIRLFGLGPYFSTRFAGIQEDLHRRKNRLLKRRIFTEIGAQAFAVALIFFSFAVVTYFAVQGRLSVGTVVLFFLVFQRGFSVLRELFQSVAGLIEDSIFMEDLLSFLNLPPVQQAKGQPARLQRPARGIRVENVRFCYPSGNREALRSVSLEIPAGRTVALVGANGSGKTTLVKLLCGFYPPSGGRILFDDQDISHHPPEEIRTLITAVFQDFALYNLAASENIRLGDIRTPANQARIRESAENAGISDVLEKLPLGFDNPLGNLFLKGEQLSMGQWQKMAIARAFYRDAPLLFLDEPSSALDAVTEMEILDRLRRLAMQKTVLIISHRLSTIRWADRIYVLHEGEVCESGTHGELLERMGRYYDMFAAGRNL